MAESLPTSPIQTQSRNQSMDIPPPMSSSSGPLAEELQCPVCLDVFTDPVTTPCGHNFCKSCLNQHWDSSQECKCPICNETFSKRPDLKINTGLRQVVQLFQEKSSLSNSEVLCDICDDKKMKALKSCLVCQNSYCEPHLEPHQRVPNLKKHKLMDPVKNIKYYICQKHERPLELFCRDDQTCICVFCTDGDHKTHNTVPLEEESKEKKTQLMKTQKDVQQMILDRIKKIHSAEFRKKSTEQEKAASVELFSDLMRFIERCQAELLEMMEEKQKAAVEQNEELIQELQQEITELKMRSTELDHLLHTDDHLHLLQIYPFLCSPPHTSNRPEISMNTDVSVETLRRALTQLQETLDEKLSQTVLRRIQQYAVDVTLDPDTRHQNLILSDDGKQVRHEDIEQKLLNNPERFDYCTCVLGKEGFSSGRFYFEVQVKGKTKWILGVAKESINRKGSITVSPRDGFWTVGLWNENKYWACTDSYVSLSVSGKLQNVGMFVDYEEGLVSFYDVESRSHIYSFTGQSFTEKLYPFFSPCRNDKGENSAPLIISPVNYVE
ncbi:E3 ubiquitin-protein ligase TRIM39-like [Labeo rohita]|uniref:E3 ubiquitin-protein ligase TRIM39-like n=1 Tax=Labeo rohita TaxID=84645 RepID=UPI0021E2A69E|nr:E3 ubiquitin-protein ligase TRIM39-like [Labeo rohita]